MYLRIVKKIIPLAMLGYSFQSYAIDLAKIEEKIGLKNEDTVNLTEIQKLVEDFVQNALAVNVQMKQSGLEVEKTNINIDMARSSFYPEIYGSASNSFKKNDPENLKEFDTRSVGLGVSVNQNLYKGFQDKWALDSAQVTKSHESLKNEVERENLAYKIKLKLIEIIEAAGKLNLAEGNLELSTEVMLATSRRFDAGLSGKVDKIDAESAVKSEKSSKNQRELIYKQKILELHGLVQTLDVDKLNVIVAKLSKYITRENLLISSQTPDVQKPKNLQQADLQVQISELNLKTSKARRFSPTLDLSASFNRGHTDYFSSFGKIAPDSSWSNTYDVSLSLRVPLWVRKTDLGIYQAAREAEHVKLQQESIQYQMNLQQGQLEEQIKHLKDSMPIYQDGYKASSEAYQAQIALYNAGTSELERVLRSVSRVISNLDIVLTAYSDLRKSEVKKEALQKGVILN